MYSLNLCFEMGRGFHFRNGNKTLGEVNEGAGQRG